MTSDVYTNNVIAKNNVHNNNEFWMLFVLVMEMFTYSEVKREKKSNTQIHELNVKWTTVYDISLVLFTTLPI